MNNWFSISNGNGAVYGLNDGGIAFFNRDSSHMHSLVREAIQNSLDASQKASGKPVGVTFALTAVKCKSLPGYMRLKDIFDKCSDSEDVKTREFFTNGGKLLNHDEMYVLRISDEATTGLAGSRPEDIDNPSTPWARLTKGRGVANSSANAGGSKGIGKSAFFAYSKLRTIFIATQDLSGYKSYIGLSKLITFEDKDQDGKAFKTTGELFYSDDADKKTAIKGDCPIVPGYGRTKTGTDIFITGFGDPAVCDKESVYDEIIYAVLRNFSISIIDRKLQVIVGNTILNADTIGRQVNECRKKTSGAAADILFNVYETYCHGEKIDIYDEVGKQYGYKKGDCTVYLRDNDSGKCRVYTAREPGMLIFGGKSDDWGEANSWPVLRNGSYTAIVRINGGKMNEDFRLMEGPTHDDWKWQGEGNEKERKKRFDWLKKKVQSEVLALKESDDEEIEAYGLEELMSGVIGTITGKQFVANNKVQSQQVKRKKVLKPQRKIEKPSAPNFVDDGSGGDNLDEKTPPVAKKAQPNEATPKTEPKWRPIDLASSRFVVKDLDSGQWVLLFQLPPKKQKKVQLALHLVTETGSHLKDLKIEKVEMLGTNSDEIRLELEEDNKLVLSPLFSINLPNKEVLILQFSCDVFQYCLMDVVCYENH